MINQGNKFVHWNHFLALEKDLETISRYVELTKDNDNTYSIELAKLLFAASSEFDVVMNELCKILAEDKKRENINDYRKIIKVHLPELIDEIVYINRFGLDFKPFLNWGQECDESLPPNESDCKNPEWWKGYNDVKHHRVEHYSKANLKNTLNAMGALIIVTTYYYKSVFEKEDDRITNFAIVNDYLGTAPQLLRLNHLYYPVDMIIP